MRKAGTVNYLNNKDILKEINKSKLTYCYLQDEKYSNYDVIVKNINDIGDSVIAEARANKAQKIQSEGYAAAMQRMTKRTTKTNLNKKSLR